MKFSNYLTCTFIILATSKQCTKYNPDLSNNIHITLALDCIDSNTTMRYTIQNRNDTGVWIQAWYLFTTAVKTIPGEELPVLNKREYRAPDIPQYCFVRANSDTVISFVTDAFSNYSIIKGNKYKVGSEYSGYNNPKKKTEYPTVIGKITIPEIEVFACE